MVSVSGPISTGILAERPSGSQGPRQNGGAEDEKDAKAAENARIRHESDLYVRPSWTDAAIALDQLEKGKAEGQRSAVWIRARLQDQLSQLGYFLQRHAGKVLFVAILALATFCVALKSVQVNSKVDQLWVQEGGRLEKELIYASEALGEAAPSTHQLVIQTPKHSGVNILHPTALDEHLAVLKAATQVTVHLFDITWRLKDLCYAPSIPNFDLHYIDQIFDSIIPCAIMTPLDCFWEGSKLLGPEYPVHIPSENNKPVQWTNLNPSRILDEMKKLQFVFPFKTLEDCMKRAGITNGYQSKPCLNPADPECPETAPNKKSQQVPDVAVELTGGCYGFAAKYMHWPEELLIGGAKHNKTGHLTRAAALQTVVQLMGERELYDFLANTYKVHHIDWSQEKAAQVLETWQRAFSNEVKKQVEMNVSMPYNLNAFSTTTLNDILRKYSVVSVMKIAIGGALMLLYAGIALLRWKDPVRSQSGVGIAGVMLICATVAAGLGFCALLGIPFNATTTQIVPFLALGLGVHDMFLLTHTYAELSVNEVPSGEQTGVVLKRTGLSVLLTGLTNVSAFFAAAIIPIPALRTFCLQTGILLLFNLAAMLLIFPAMVSLDLRRRRSGRKDILCCCLPALPNLKKNKYSMKNNGTVKQMVTRAIPPERRETCTQILTSHNTQNESWIGGHIDVELEKQCTEEDALTGCSQDDCLSFSLTKLAARHYAPFISRPSTKVFGMMILVIVLAGSVWEAMRVRDGLDLTDLVPQNSNEHAFLAAQAKHFGFYNMYAITGRDFEYPNNQRLLYEYHDAFVRIKNVIKNDNGGLSEFWLGLFRDWLKNLQAAFDKDYNNGCITQERWYKNASDEAILAYKLLVQTGYVDNPIDKTLITQVRLVDSEGIINPRAFYNYLSAWASNDALAYGASQANLRPEPRQWIYTNDHELKIPKSMPLTYAQMPFNLHKLTDTQQITELIGSIRKLCKRFEERGLPNFPSGIPFLFWEQYMDLRSCLGIALLAALSASIIIVGVLLLNMWATLLVGISLGAVVLQLLGIMGLFDIKLSAVPAVLLVISVGIAVHFTVHICLSFITSVGSRDRRMRLALEHMCAPIVHGALTMLLAVAMLAFSEFDFIVKYFFFIPLCVIGVGLVNGIFFFPILLSLIGPSAEVIPNDYPDRISTPTPPASPIVRRSKPPAPPRRSHKIENARLHAEPSLTTITEEPNSWHSTQESCIIVQPELKVETTSTCGNQNCSGSDTSGSSRTSPIPSTPHITTKVTATANIKVEVHTPLTSGVDRSEKCRHTSTGSRRSSRCSANVNAGESSGSSSEPDSDFNPKH